MNFKQTIKKLLSAQMYMWIKYLQLYNLKPMLEQNKDLENIHLGERCFILGNGPSIKNLDFSLLKNEYTFTVNQISRNPNFPKLHTNYHVWADAIFFKIDKSKPEDRALLDVMKAVRTNDNSPLVFYKCSALEMVNANKLNEFLNIRFFQTIPPYDYDLEKLLNYNYKITGIIPDFSTVVQQAICIAIFMGFKKIYLLGCDCTSFITYAETRLGNAERSSYGYKIDVNEKKRLENTIKVRTLTDELRGICNMMDQYEVIYRFSKIHDVAIYNSTPRSLLNTFPYLCLEDVLKKD